MTFLHLQYFCEIVQQNSLSKAAEKLHIVQPALSKMLSSLESELGVKLFDRIGRSLVLNEYGNVLYKNAEHVLSVIDGTLLELKEMSKRPVGQIHIGIYAASYLLPSLMIDYMDQHPGVTFHTYSLSTSLHNMSRSYDLCIHSAPLFQKELYSQELLTEDFVIALSRQHPLAQAESLYLSELHDANFVALYLGASRTSLESFCQQAGFIPNIVFECNDIFTLKTLVSAGTGIAFIPSITWRPA